MKCPVCKQDAKAHLYYCARCAVYVHEKCWSEHCATEHKETD